MNDTVPTTVKPSGGFIAPAPETTTPVRTFTYPLLHGGSLTVDCPKWCTADHSGDLSGIHPGDLCHEGDEIRLTFTTSCNEESDILAACITQFPFASGDGSERPHMAFMPDAGSGETLGYQTAAEVNETIARVRRHLDALVELSARLGEACADDHAAHHRSLDEKGNPLRNRVPSLRDGDIETMPVHYLLDVFEARVVEVEELPDGLFGSVDRIDGQLVVNLLRRLPQSEREAAVRQMLADLFNTEAAR